MFSPKLLFTIIIGLLAAVLTGYAGALFLSNTRTSTSVPSGGGTATAVPTSVTSTRPTTVRPAATIAPQPTVVPTPVDAQPRTPTFAFEPQQGRPGTVVAVRGWNFAPNSAVHIGIGFPSKAGPALASVTADSAGVWEAQVTIPEVQLSPGPDWSRARLLVLDGQSRPVASAPFSFTPAAAPTLDGATQTVRDLLDAYIHADDVRPYLDAGLRAKFEAGQHLGQVLGLQPSTLVSFEVGAPEDRPSEVLFVPARLVYSMAEEQRIFTLVVEDGAWRVNGSFVRSSGESPTLNGAVQTVREFLTHFAEGADALLPYLATSVRAEVDAGKPIDQVFGLPAMAWQTFSVGDPLNQSSEVLFVPVMLTYPSFTEARTFTLVVEDGSWRINGSSQTNSPEQPAPSPGADDWQSVLAADINADGITEQIAYRPAPITLQGPVGFADPRIVEVLIVEELVVSQEVSPGGRTLLHLTRAELRADAQLLATFDNADEPPAGFLVVVYGGERYSYHVNPLTADGTLSLQGVEVVWSQLEHGYRQP